jgi:hypothetical protein
LHRDWPEAAWTRWWRRDDILSLDSRDDLATNIPLCLRNTDLWLANETELIGDQCDELRVAGTEVSEEPIDRCLEVGESGIVLIPERSS